MTSVENKAEAYGEDISIKGNILLLLDYDGTLVPIADKPELAIPGKQVLDILGQITARADIVPAIISGRDLESLKELLPVSGLCLVGCHGAEVEYPDGARFEPVNTGELAPILDRLAEIATRCINGGNGFLLERKKAAIALHYRLAEPDRAEKVVREFTLAAKDLAAENQLELLAGKKVIEVRPQKVNKGQAVRHLIQLYPNHYPVYLGDDTTDEDAFRILQDRGTGILVSARARPSAAMFRFREPEVVLGFLQKLATRC